MKSKITAFIHELIMYDYILFGSAFFLFILFIVIAILIRRKRGVAIFLVLFAFAILLLSPTLGYIKMHKYLFKNSIEITSQKRLHFSDAIMVKGHIKNESKFDFSACSVSVKVHRSSKNSLRNYLYQFKTIQKASIVIENISKGTDFNFKMFVEPFTYQKPYNLSIEAKCK